MTARPRLGVVFTAQRAIGELPEAARQVERLGFDELWVVEDCFAFGGLAAAGAALAATRRLRVGIGLLPVSVRNPAIAAMELATVAGLYPGRLDVAFGHGVESWMRQIGARPDDRVAALAEIMTVTRALLHGEVVDHHGRFARLADVRLEQPPASPPGLFAGTTGERGIAVARAARAGVLLPEGPGPEAIAWVAGRLGGGPVATYAWLSIAEDGEAARARLDPVFQDWSAWGLYPKLIARGAPEAIAGTAHDCAEMVARMGAAGASAIALIPVGPDPGGQLERFAAQALPLIS